MKKSVRVAVGTFGSNRWMLFGSGLRFTASLAALLSLLVISQTAWSQARAGCPISRSNGVRLDNAANTTAIPPQSMLCLGGLRANVGERINFRVEASSESFRIEIRRAHDNAFMTGPTRVAGHPTSNPVWAGDNNFQSIENFSPYESTNYNGCILNNSAQRLSARFTLDVVGPECDRLPDGCSGARGGACTVTWAGHLGCMGRATPNNDMVRHCAVSVGSNRHDDCCYRRPGGDWCSQIGYNGAQTSPDFINDPNQRPGNLTFSDVHDYLSEGGSPWRYRLCKKEWDMAGGDDTGWNRAAWYDWFDSTLMVYRNNPAELLVTRAAGAIHSDRGQPTAAARRAPAGQQIRLIDAQDGWCATGAYSTLDGNRAQCITPGGGGGRPPSGPPRKMQ